MNRWKNKAAPVFLIAALLVGWEAVVRIREIPLYVLPAPSQVVEALIANRGTLAAHGAVTVAEALAGMAIALLLALVIGIAMDAFPAVKSGVYPVLVVTQQYGQRSKPAASACATVPGVAPDMPEHVA